MIFSCQRIGVVAVCLMPAAAAAQTCTTGATTLSFGTYNPSAVVATAMTGTVTVNCSALVSLLVSYQIQLSTGNSGTYTSRSLIGPSGSVLSYQVYREITYSTVWGNGSAGAPAVTDGYLVGVITVTRNYTAYGQIPARQLVAPGGYSDAIAVTLIY